MKNPELIFDIGMHTGRDTEFYLRKGFKVIAIEANPALVSQGKEKFKVELEKGQLVIVDKAISAVPGEIDFFVFKNKDDWGTIYPSWNRSMDSNVSSIKVESITLDSLIEKYGTPYYMKIDIEGADIVCLKSLLQQKERPENISVELLTPNNLGEEVDALDILCYLKVLGYNKFLVSDQSKNASIKSPQPALEGKYVDFKFDSSSSGLFGKELLGEWMSIDEISIKYLNYFHPAKPVKESNSFSIFSQSRKKNTSSDNNIFHLQGWFDVHAKI